MGQFSKNFRSFNLKNCHKALKNMYLGSGIRNKPIPDPWIPDPGSKRHRIPDPDPQHCLFYALSFAIFAFLLSFAGSLLATKKKLSGFLQRGTKVRVSLYNLLLAMFQTFIDTSVDYLVLRHPDLHEIFFIFLGSSEVLIKKRSLRQIVFVLVI